MFFGVGIVLIASMVLVPMLEELLFEVLDGVRERILWSKEPFVRETIFEY